ncbi:MAG: protein kinase family protein [Marmoricola sp.]
MGIGPGSVLGGRYRIDVLLSEVGSARFWLGIDTALSRKVAIHTVPNTDDRAPLLVEAARDSASVVHANILRVLDCTVEDELTWVVNEWGEGSSLHDLVGSGPLPFERAAWLSLEVASAIAEAHRADVAHGRLNPEAVIVTRTGEVKLIGFAVNGALRGEAHPISRYGKLSTFEADVVDLASILYVSTTGRWPGSSPSSIPAPPMDMHGPLRPRQVRAGVPRDLDGLCRRVLRDEGFDHSLPIESAHEIYAALSDFVGDPARWAPGSIAEIHHSPKDVTLPHPRPSDSWLHSGLIPVIDAVLGPDTGPMITPAPAGPELEPVPPVPTEGLLRPTPEEAEDEVLPGTDRWLFGEEPARRAKPAHPSTDVAPDGNATQRRYASVLVGLAVLVAVVLAFVLGLRG